MQPRNIRQGQSILPHLQNRTKAWDDFVVTCSEPGRYRIRDERYAYTRYPDQDMDTLFDLSNDPHELDNLCHGDRGMEPIISEMRAKLVDWFAAQAIQGHQWEKRGCFPPVLPSRVQN